MNTSISMLNANLCLLVTSEISSLVNRDPGYEIKQNQDTHSLNKYLVPTMWQTLF